eukprot:m.18001 g.18001  ORF g.18001 m.18001 type:complete len:59 (-) comp6163_c1_seq1:280-456(-)
MLSADKKKYAAAFFLRTTQRYLKKMGYRRGKRKQQNGYREKESALIARDLYVKNNVVR